MKYYFSPSLMCMDLMQLEYQTRILNERADFYHVDIMDGHFVKNITLSPMFVQQISKTTTLPIDVHLMVENPNDFIDVLADAGAQYISPHAETINKDAFRTIAKIKERGCKVGIVVNPATPLSYISQYMDLVDKLTIMTVDAGFAGQKFIESMLDKISEAKKLREEHGYHYLIEVDGSCNEKTFAKLARAGTDIFIVGTSGLFHLDDDLEKAWEKMMEIFRKSVPDAD